MSFTESLGQIAPYYNLAFAFILLVFFVLLFKTRRNKDVYLKPWVLLLAGFLVFILEEVFTVLRAAGVIKIPVHVNGFFELVIIICFIYAVLLQKEHVKQVHRGVVPVARADMRGIRKVNNRVKRKAPKKVTRKKSRKKASRRNSKRR